MVRVRVGVRVGVGQTVTGRVPEMSPAEFAHRATYSLVKVVVHCWLGSDAFGSAWVSAG